MATTTTEKVTVTLQDESGHNQSFQIDNADSDTTLASIRMKLAPAIATNAWCSSFTVPFIRVRGATIIQQTKTPLDEGSQTIRIEPNPATIQTTSQKGTQTFTVEGMTIEGFDYQYLSGDTTITPYIRDTTINTEANTITATFNTPNAGTAKYNFIITSGAYTLAIPVTVERT